MKKVMNETKGSTSASDVIGSARLGSARGTARTNASEQTGGSKSNKDTKNTKKDNMTPSGKNKKKRNEGKREKLPNTIIKDAIDPANKKLWGGIEKKLEDDLYKLLGDLEHNKFRTHEPRLPPVYIRDIYGKIIGEEDPAVVASKKLAKQMMHAKRDVVQAIEDEELKDAARKLVEDQCTTSKKLKETLKKHEKERHNFRRYLRTLQYDNELVLINAMTKYGLLW